MIDEIKTQLAQMGETLQAKGINDNTTWTKEIKKTLIALGKKNNLVVCAGGKDCESDWWEWLFDLCWLELDDGIVKNMVLAVESEWAMSDEKILEDFQKLLVCNAEIKLFIFQDRKDLIGLFEKAIKKYKYTNGKFLLAMYNNVEIQFEYTVV